ncbi:helix-turn-helix domain-containing protein [Rhodococcus sp. BP-252]|uniref:AraC-like ligand-binding domain-containing protein n=1 Tax=unclassified Rhodococcus (in: high G+C Gram-positive bacteria) TaxID=192944 RepID=UPI001C9A8C49|nr:MULTISPECIES: helix-turn-helix domain-containing protein [unclassified Rhodococcus (in: high G+C Gram-positive bacteria)]MBY6412816.1 helix-turn-helix domain-containing protein [Rhodococcus sp. BP-320]MBY6417647.1 helix-turn-helix domain-containing protein [Rhodococcus sp. BP-321]MBY6423499.1 helix-turn-helix domain-containing protein [Rhodococcus sp. BP-324]MBY6427671.1 helix-turn-helix domain-containing protein [Rhodococcus sp. BP-323]MBY6432835.1 helix-turn-helix domain-containing protei
MSAALFSPRSSDSVGEEWRTELGSTFAGLHPERIDSSLDPMTGHIDSSDMGDLRIFRVTGTPQIVRRSKHNVRTSPTEALKLCRQVRGRAIVHQDDRELVIEPGQLGIYDTGRAYDLRLEGDWECSVMVFPPSALQLPHRWLNGVMNRVHDASTGAGSVLSYFMTSALDQPNAQSRRGSAELRFAEAGLHLLSSAVAPVEPADSQSDAVAQRLSILDHIRRNLSDPHLTHANVASAHGISPRTLDRLFESESRSVTTAIRELRLDAARRDLLDPRSMHTNVGAVAARWCLNDAAHFSRLYKQRFGVSPSADREAAGRMSGGI